jgi:hypothetical protein
MPFVMNDSMQAKKKTRASSFSGGIEITNVVEYEQSDLLLHLQSLSQQNQQQEESNNTYFGVQRDEFIEVFADVLQAIAENGDQNQNQNRNSIFYAANPPDITIFDYLQRILKFTMCSSVCYLFAMVYLDRIVQLNPTFVISSQNVHRLILTSIMTAAKFFDEKFSNNAYFAKVGGISTSEINSLEMEFLSMIQYQLHIYPCVYEKYKNELFDEHVITNEEENSCHNLSCLQELVSSDEH